MSSQELQNARPLSPHLSIYKPIPTMMMSIVHRITGIALYFGTLLIAWWLFAAASGEAYFEWVNGIMGSLIGRLILFGYTWALMHHMIGGIKHLFWDVGLGLEKETSTRLAYMSLIGSVILTILIWVVGYMVR
ncbi:MAG: succinate dehydrogenase, cytochrome b556 subunit [Rhizobiaceae bacterium]|nr:succinate dehydrogenase, cytochrome b556 subunit [Rhizobiaceae bacterium]MBL4695646.1 succinate dehydrogenase, cytochrome b556 subunit [Rhizobiaceae bacterium]